VKDAKPVKKTTSKNHSKKYRTASAVAESLKVDAPAAETKAESKCS